VRAYNHGALHVHSISITAITSKQHEYCTAATAAAVVLYLYEESLCITTICFSMSDAARFHNEAVAQQQWPALIAALYNDETHLLVALEAMLKTTLRMIR
jgi:hypothetical protein